MALSEATLEELWYGFLNEKESIIPKAYLSDIKILVPVWIDENSFKFVVTSSVIKGSIDNIKPEIYNYFVLRCLASPLQILIEIERNEEDFKVKKNAKERLADMVQNNPKVISLIQKFDLDLNI